MAHRYYSERQGYRSPTTEQIGSRFWLGFLDYVNQLIVQGILVESFPIQCQDGQGTCDTDIVRLNMRLQAEIAVAWPLIPDPIPDTLKVLDLVEFFGRYVSEPKSRTPHSYWRHVDYSDFSRTDGLASYSAHINDLFRLCGHPFRIENGQVERLGPSVLSQALLSSIFDTGDVGLNELLEGAKVRFLDPNPTIRRDALEKLWDAWERLKTIEDADKKKGADKLLEKAISNIPLKEKIEQEAKTLTDIGNSYRIRHHERGKIELTSEMDVDYLFYRMFGLIWRLLKGTGRVR